MGVGSLGFKNLNVSFDSDAELFALMKVDLFTAVVGDVLDVLNYQNQFLDPGITPLDPLVVLVGRAMTVLEADYGEGSGEGSLSQVPFGLMFAALDSLAENEIYIATGSSFSYALWGELMSTRAMQLKAAGVILNGFARGLYAQDQAPRGKVIDYRCAITIRGVKILSGDLIFADREGVLVIPRVVEKDAIKRALEKVSTESEVAKAIKAGMSATEAFESFGVM